MYIFNSSNSSNTWILSNPGWDSISCLTASGSAFDVRLMFDCCWSGFPSCTGLTVGCSLFAVVGFGVDGGWGLGVDGGWGLGVAGGCGTTVLSSSFLNQVIDIHRMQGIYMNL